MRTAATTMTTGDGESNHITTVINSFETNHLSEGEMYVS